jgi:hypothetical protein
MPKSRYEKFKDIMFYGTLILLIILPVIVISPIGKNAAKWYVYRHNSAEEEVQPDATKMMYYLGRYYSITLDDNGAREVFKELFKWYQNKDKTKISPDDPWVGRALFYDAKLLEDTGHKQWGKRRYKVFMMYFGNNPEIPAEMKSMAKRRAGVY